MKKLLITLLVLLLVGGLIFGLLYFFWTAENFALLAERAMEKGKYSRAVNYYEKAFELDPENSEYALVLADSCIAEGNFTKAERYLVNAIREAPSLELYLKLSEVYLAQDKLLDAQEMLDNVNHPEISDALAELRPEAPVFSYESGEYDEYISVELSAATGTIYFSLNAEYPSCRSEAYAQPIELTSGENTITAIAVADNGLVSPLASANYLIRGVVEEVTFASPELEAYVRDVLYLPRTDAITTEDLWSFTELTITPDITDYSDLRHFVNLTSLTIRESSVEDFSFLAYTPELVKLDFYDSNITAETIALIGDLEKLENLNLGSCGISNIAALSGNKNLVILDLSENSVSDLSPLANITSLEELYLSSNAITGIDSLQKLTNLVVLDLSENNITELTALEKCSKLETFKADGNQIAFIEVAKQFTKLKTLTVSRNKISNISALSACADLGHLEVAENELTSIDVIAGLTKLTYLDASYNAITALPALQKTAPLQKVNLAHNQIKDISSLAGLISLYYVNVEYNSELKDIECLASCYCLARVDAFGTKVTEVRKLLEMSVIVNYDPSIAINQG